MRPRYHYAPASNWLSDPNGLVHHAGEWHLFYQYNPEGEDWGHMSWGHAVSPDLATWEELPVALRDDARHMIFSGSAVIDAEDSAGFGREAMIALYTGAMSGEPPRQVQCLAASTDRGRTWREYAGNPVIDRDLADFRDPNVFWHAPSQRWIMVVVLSNEQRAVIYASHDLKQWDEMSVIPGMGAPGEVWECPLLIELPVEGADETRWLFKVDVLRGAPGSGALYQTGTFDGIRFHPDGPALEPWWQVADWGADFYAAIAWHEPRDARGRPLWIGWMGNHTYQGKLPVKGWRGAMSMPRRIWLRRSGERFVLCQEPEAATVAGVPRGLDQARELPIAAQLRMPGHSWRLLLQDEAGRSIVLERSERQLRAVRQDPHCPALDLTRDMPLGPAAELDLWLDAGSLEVLGEGGASALTLQHCLTAERIGCRLDISASL